jgi:hypothetical protein
MASPHQILSIRAWLLPLMLPPLHKRTAMSQPVWLLPMMLLKPLLKPLPLLPLGLLEMPPVLRAVAVAGMVTVAEAAPAVEVVA